jgi:hypothetical protein
LSLDFITVIVVRKDAFRQLALFIVQADQANEARFRAQFEHSAVVGVQVSAIPVLLLFRSKNFFGTLG